MFTEFSFMRYGHGKRGIIPETWNSEIIGVKPSQLQSTRRRHISYHK